MKFLFELLFSFFIKNKLLLIFDLCKKNSPKNKNLDDFYPYSCVEDYYNDNNGFEFNGKSDIIRDLNKFDFIKYIDHKFEMFVWNKDSKDHIKRIALYYHFMFFLYTPEKRAAFENALVNFFIYELTYDLVNMVDKSGYKNLIEYGLYINFHYYLIYFCEYSDFDFISYFHNKIPTYDKFVRKDKKYWFNEFLMDQYEIYINTYYKDYVHFKVVKYLKSTDWYIYYIENERYEDY